MGQYHSEDVFERQYEARKRMSEALSMAGYKPHMGYAWARRVLGK